MENVPDSMVLTVDCGALPPVRVLRGDAGGPMLRVGESLGLRGVAMCPVFRCSDIDEVLAEVAAVSADHRRGACLRVSTAEGLSDPLPCADEIRDLLRAVRLAPEEEVDLLFDAGPVHSGRVREALAEATIEALRRLSRWPWRRLCVAAGAFPANLKGFRRGVATPVVREDARLWQSVAEKWPGQQPEFGLRSDVPPHLAKEPWDARSQHALHHGGRMAGLRVSACKAGQRRLLHSQPGLGQLALLARHRSGYVMGGRATSGMRSTETTEGWRGTEWRAWASIEPQSRRGGKVTVESLVQFVLSSGSFPLAPEAGLLITGHADQRG